MMPCSRTCCRVQHDAVSSMVPCSRPKQCPRPKQCSSPKAVLPSNALPAQSIALAQSSARMEPCPLSDRSPVAQTAFGHPDELSSIGVVARHLRVNGLSPLFHNVHRETDRRHVLCAFGPLPSPPRTARLFFLPAPCPFRWLACVGKNTGRGGTETTGLAAASRVTASPFCLRTLGPRVLSPCRLWLRHKWATSHQVCFTSGLRRFWSPSLLVSVASGLFHIWIVARLVCLTFGPLPRLARTTSGPRHRQPHRQPRHHISLRHKGAAPPSVRATRGLRHKGAAPPSVRATVSPFQSRARAAHEARGVGQGQESCDVPQAMPMNRLRPMRAVRLSSLGRMNSR